MKGDITYETKKEKIVGHYTQPCIGAGACAGDETDGKGGRCYDFTGKYRYGLCDEWSIHCCSE